ncbi:Uncharacterised protein [Legionella cherrii]|uniref:Uncharacterized protein n=1 Tax=Legionella cherrii TaxID=28084 RepID=A0A0W0S9C9_9GAMM|nr:hypothetical protein Lche_2210 [Legionella cherrii]VEB38647.1 Uncharacterised protein [Legionella cherrii]
MSYQTCHYCLEITNYFSLRGKSRAINGKFLCYQLCPSCTQKLISINSFSDKESRQFFINAVKENAQKFPLYVDE